MAEDRASMVEAMRRGDRSAMESAARVARAVVCQRGYWVDRADREDLVQEVMVQVHHAVSAPGFRLDVSVEALVRTIAHRRCVDWMRRLRPLEDDPPDSTSTEPSPEDNVLADERLRRVREAFAALGYSCRRIIGLRVGESLSYREVAVRMDSTEASIRVRMHRCLKRLRTLVDPPDSAVAREAERED